MIYRITLIIISALLTLQTAAQGRFTVSGYIKDSLTGETLIGATLTVDGEKSKGVSSNQYGYYSITLPNGEYRMSCSYVGYEAQQATLHLDKNQSFNFLLPPRVSTSTEVVVYSKR